MKNIWENETGIITLATDKQAEKLNYVGGISKKQGKIQKVKNLCLLIICGLI